jgi:SAM-dependent methyltransferase
MSQTSSTKVFEVVEYGFGKKGHYDVASYDAVRYLGPSKQYQQTVMANAYTKLIGPVAGKRILDVGCGTGRGVLDFARKACMAIGVDASLDMLTCAKGKITNDLNCSLAASVAQKLPFPDAAFDVVTSLNFLHLFGVETQRMIVVEMKRVVKPGGLLLVDFANALNGLVLGMYKRLHGTVGLLLPGEIRYVIGDDCRLARVYGAPLPAVWRLFYHFPRLGAAVEKIAYIPPFNWLAHEVYCKVLKGT